MFKSYLASKFFVYDMVMTAITVGMFFIHPLFGAVSIVICLAYAATVVGII